jgi:hypothetical protein
MASLALGPLTRTTAIAAGGRPDDNAKIVSRQFDITDHSELWACDLISVRHQALPDLQGMKVVTSHR